MVETDTSTVPEEEPPGNTWSVLATQHTKNRPLGKLGATPARDNRSLDNRGASDLSTLTIDDRGDGGSKDDKFDGDISILTKVLEQEPDNGRYMFYLAECYRHGKRYRSAIEWYRKGIDRGSWQEETWYARYMIGACHEALGELPEATVAYLDAHTDRPTRAEPLHDLARLWRVKGNPRLGHFLTKRASEVPTYEEICKNSRMPKNRMRGSISMSGRDGFLARWTRFSCHSTQFQPTSWTSSATKPSSKLGPR